MPRVRNTAEPWKVLLHQAGQRREVCMSRHATYAEARQIASLCNAMLLLDDTVAGRKPEPSVYCYPAHEQNHPAPHQISRKIGEDREDRET